MAQVSTEIINLLSEEYLTAKIEEIILAIEREKLLGNTNYSLEGENYAKK
jgi:hypothetical protein